MVPIHGALWKFVIHEVWVACVFGAVAVVSSDSLLILVTKTLGSLFHQDSGELHASTSTYTSRHRSPRLTKHSCSQEPVTQSQGKQTTTYHIDRSARRGDGEDEANATARHTRAKTHAEPLGNTTISSPAINEVTFSLSVDGSLRHLHASSQSGQPHG